MADETQRLHFRITGMTCGACAQRVERAMRDVEGVDDASVNLLAESATVQAHDREITSKLVERVRAAGYEAEAVAAGRDLLERLSSDREHRETLRRHRQALVQAIGLALPVIALEYLIPYLWGTDPTVQVAGRLLQIVLLVMLAVSPAGAPILVGGLRAVIHRAGNMELLITTGVVAAFVSGVYGTLAHDPSFIHFHAAAMILAIVCVGRYLETRARGRATAAIAALAKRAPKEALVRRGDAWETIAADRVSKGDEVRVPVHAAIPVDGDVIDGSAEVDERLLTGEPMPVTKRTGDRVSAGTLVIDGQIDIRATEVGQLAALGRVASLVEQAQHGRTQMQRMADKLAAVLTPAIVLVAIATFAGWMVFGGAMHAAHGARAAIAVLVVACPCALGLATPTATMVATSMAALRGILVRDATTLETMGRIDTVVWDKTGTLTAGEPLVAAVAAADGIDEGEMVRLAASSEKYAAHPLGKAIVREAQRRDLVVVDPASFDSKPGLGVIAKVEGKAVQVGSRRLLSENGVDVGDFAGDASRTATRVLVALDGRYAGSIDVADAIRPSAASAIRRLQEMNVQSHLLTGDAAPAARAVAKEVGIAADHVRAGVDPAGKHTQVESLRKAEHKVAMVGDGINDAAALAAADVGVAFATGADVAVESAGISLVGSTPHLVADAVEISRLAVRSIRQNLFWAFFYNVLMIPLAATGHIAPALAAAAMMLSSLTVVLNAIRIPRIWRKQESARLQAGNE